MSLEASSTNEINIKILLELDRMERCVAAAYSDTMRGFSKFLRIDLWNDETAIYLYLVLFNINDVFETFAKNHIFNNYDFISLYMDVFKGVWVRVQPFYYNAYKWKNIQEDIDGKITDVIIKKQWEKINPFIKEIDSENYDINLIEIFDYLFENCILPNEKYFTKQYKSINLMYRGAKGIHDESRIIPNPKYSSLNRWNPKGQCFVYAAIEDNDSIFDIQNNIYHGEMVCAEELRAKKGDKLTIGKLEFLPRLKHKKVFDFSYNDKSISMIENELQNERKQLSEKIIESVSQIIKDDSENSFQNVHQIIKNEKDKRLPDMKLIAGKYVAMILLKRICDNIYIPLDSDEDIDPNKKEKCYGAFHVMAEYIKDRGYAGIIYPSTRAARIKQSGKNIVIFNYQDVIYKANSLKAVEYN